MRHQKVEERSLVSLIILLEPWLRILLDACGISIADSTATTDTHGSTSDTYGRWNIASQRGSWQLRTTRVRHPTDDRHDDDDNGRDGT